MALQPLPQVVITAARIRRQLLELLKEVDELEASCGVGYEPKRKVEFAFPIEKKTKRRKS